MRTKALAAIVAALLFALLCVQVGAQKSERTKRVFVGRGSETAQGSRVTITSDDSLKDYSAYRSGDRFIVVLPKASAGSVARGAGKGYSDVQVQQRGNDVVVSYRVAPGAKPRVQQKFNRLEVVFDVPADAQASAPANSNTSKTPAQTPPANKNQTASQQTPPQTTNANTGKTNTPPAANTGQTATGATNATAPPIVAEQPKNAGQPAPEAAQTPSPAPSVEQQQVAQVNTPNTIAPITTTNPAAGTNASSGSGFSIGTFLIRNWAVALVIALVVAGLGLIIAARRSSAASPAPLEESETKPALEEARASGLEAASTATLLSATETKTKTKKSKNKKKTKADAKTSTSEAKKSKDAEPSLAAATLAAVPSAEESKDEKWDEELAIVGEPEAVEPVETPEPEAAVETPTLETSTVETPTLEASTEATELAEETALAGTVADASAEAAPEVGAATEPEVEATTGTEVHEVAEESATVESAFVESGIDSVEGEVGEVTTEVVPATEIAPSEVASSATEVVAAPEAESEVTGIALFGAPDPDSVQAEARRVLEGEQYDRSVVGAADPMARQIIAAELLSALSGRNFERRERARAAFVEHGYFDERARDLSEAEAPAERAAAARALAIVGDRAATPFLIDALGDTSIDVRRAAVEALGALRDPAAIRPLESLLERERQERIRIPPRVVRNAIEVCREAEQEEAQAQAAPVVEATPEVVPVAEETTTAVAPVEESAVEEVAEEATAITPVEEGAHSFEESAVEETAAVGALEEEPQAIEEEETAAFERVEMETLAGVSEASEATAAEPHVVEETGVQPYVGTDEVVEESTLSAVDFVEPPVAEVEQTAGDAAVSEVSEEVSEASAESKQVALFEGGADAGGWVDFDVTAKTFGDSAAAEETSGAVFEASSGAALKPDIAHAVEEEAAREFEVERGIEPSSERAERSVERASEQFEEYAEPSSAGETASRAGAGPASGVFEKGVAPFDEHSTVPASIQQRLASREPSERAAAINELSHADSDEAFQQICAAFDDEAKEVRGAAARALYELRADRAESFTRALREATPERRRQIGSAISSSGLASEAISQLTGESREKTYEAFSLLFLMAKAGEVQPLIRAIEGHPNNEVRLAVVKLLALSGQKEILPAFRRLAVRGSLPTEVRSAVMEAIYQISSSQPSAA